MADGVGTPQLLSVVAATLERLVHACDGAGLLLVARFLLLLRTDAVASDAGRCTHPHTLQPSIPNLW